VVEMTDTDQRLRGGRPARRTRGFSQPESTLALRPSQRRAATNRAARREQRSAMHWLRGLARS
jgi:hypothetical protein